MLPFTLPAALAGTTGPPPTSTGLPVTLPAALAAPTGPPPTGVDLPADFPVDFAGTGPPSTGAGLPVTLPATLPSTAAAPAGGTGLPVTLPATLPSTAVAGQLISGALTVTATATGTAGTTAGTGLPMTLPATLPGGGGGVPAVGQTLAGSLNVTAAGGGAARGGPQPRTITGGRVVTAHGAGALTLTRIGAPPLTVAAPRVGPPANQLLDTDHIVALRTISGVQLQQFGPREYTTLKWGRELRDVSSCDMVLPPLLDLTDRLPEVVPWLHWLSVYSTKTRMLLWDGPIQKLSSTRDSATITAKDIGCLMTRTRTPLTKRWDSQDVSAPAGELWNAMVALHNLSTTPIIRQDPANDRFDFAVRGDEKMMDGPIGDLVNLGLRWTVVAGVPIIGPISRRPVAELGEHDFVGGGVELIRDGSQFFNDVLLRGPDSLARTRVDRHGLNLQTIVDVDSVFGVSNAERATAAYARYVSDVRDSVGLSEGSVLHPDAPVGLDDLIPGARFTLSAYGLRSKQELESMSVTISSGKADVGIKLESVVDKDDLPELAELVQEKTGAPV